MVIQHNLTAMYTKLNLNIASKNKAKSAEKLTSGYQINKAADDAAGLSISENMRSQIRGLDKSAENIQDGISYCNVADGALEEVHSMLGRLKELSVYAATDTNTDNDRQLVDEEVQNLKEEINSIFQNTSFNGKNIWEAAYVPNSGGYCKDFSYYNVSDSNGTYCGGIIYRNHRYSWSDLGINNWDASTQTFTSDETFNIDANVLHNNGLNSDNDSSSTKDDYISFNNSGAQFTITTMKGASSFDIQKSYSWSADNTGIYIDHVMVDSSDPITGNTTWAAMGITTGQHVNGGTYSFTYYGMDVTFDVPDGGDDWNDFLGGINNDLMSIDWHSESFSSVAQEVAYIGATTNNILIDNTNKDYISDETMPYKIYADEDGVWLTNAGDAVSPMTKDGANADLLAWEDLQSYDGDSIKSWGLDTNGDGTTNVNAPTNIEGGDQYVTLNWDTPYTYQNSYLGSGASLFGFGFNMLPESSLPAAIADLNNTLYFNNGISSPTAISSYLSGGGEFLSSGVYSALSFLTQRDTLNRAFNTYTETFASAAITQSGSDYILTLTGSDGGSYSLTANATTLASTLENDITTSMQSLYNSVKTNPSDVAALSSNATNLGLSAYQVTFQNGADTIALQLDLSNVTYADIISALDYTSTSETPYSGDFGDKVLDYVKLNLDEFAKSTFTISANGATNQDLTLMQNSEKETTHSNVAVVDGFELGLRIKSGPQPGDTIKITYDYLRLGSLGIKTTNVSSRENATNAITEVDRAIDKVSEQRAVFGAYTSRLLHAYDVNKNGSENLQAAESLKRDTQMENEIVNYNKYKIIEQVGQSILAQANQMKDMVLELLK